MVIKVGINGFGRVGRIVSRACLLNPSLQLSAINDPAISVDYVCYLMKFDSTHGRLARLVTHSGAEVIIDGLRVKVSHEKCPSDVPWQAAGVEYVVEASGMFTNFEKASGHLLSTGVKRVIVTAPSVDIPMLILGVNDNSIPPDCRVISCTSSTLYCLAPIIKVLEDSYGVEDGFVTSIHAMTPSLKPLDGLCLRGRHWRDHRSIHQNIIPAPTGACKALGKIMPSVKDKLTGIAFRVPIVNVSVLDLTVRLQKNTNLPDIIKDVRQASNTYLRKIIKVSNEEAVSSDFMADSHSCIFDENSCIQLKPNFFKIICWYENEHSYACRVVDSIIFSENQFYLESPINMKCLRPIMLTKMLQTDVLACRCSNRSSELMSNVSRDIAIETKSPIGSAVNVQKDFMSVPVKPKFSKTDDLIKIWNHRSEMRPSLEPVRCSFFHSYVNYPLQSVKKIEPNTHDRLEDVKREFTKMVNITEDLLRKTQSNQGVKSITKVDMKSGSSHLKVKEDGSKPDAKSNSEVSDKVKSIAPLDLNCSGDTIQVSNEKFTKSDCTRSSSQQKSEFTDCHSNITGDSRNLLDITEDIKELVEEEKEALIQLEGKKSNQNILKLNKFQGKQKTETLKKFDNKLMRNKQFRCVWNSPYDIIADSKIQKNIKSSNNECNVPDLTGPQRECISQTEKTKVFLELDSLNNARDEINSKITICETEKEKSTEKNKSNNEETKVCHGNTNTKTIEDELNELKEKSTRNSTDVQMIQHNLRFEANAQANRTSSGSEDIASTCIKPEIKPVKVHVKQEDARQQSNSDMDLPIHMLSGETSKYVSPVNTMTNLSGLCGERQDIYDKLDSTSGSESNNSFEVHERKSQVIQLTDLSNSLEDLARLNNICRIIEISDELSDKLFSALDESESDMKKKRWSFKDLCTKLKLDDFCNKVFGGSPV